MLENSLERLQKLNLPTINNLLEESEVLLSFLFLYRVYCVQIFNCDKF